ncbi:MAG: hypothetical protein AAGM67_17315 [Bacteroidota bacterium]
MKTRFWVEVFSLWFMNEIVFIVLPIVVILLIDIAFNNQIETVLLLPEWSFAAIVLYGVAISTTIELKVKYNTNFSPKLFAGSKALTILLIGAVITLTLAVLRENAVAISPMFIQISQAILFVHSLLSVFFVVFARQEHLWLPERYPQRFTDQELMQYVVHLTKDADTTLGQLLFALEKTGFDSSKIHPRDEAYFSFFIDEIEKSIGKIKENWKNQSGSSGIELKRSPEQRPQLPPIHEARREVTP